MKRPEVNIVIEKTSFLMEKMEYIEQYGTIYFDRLKRLRPLLEISVKKVDSNICIVEKLSHIPQGTVALIGTLFKKSKKIPTLLNQYKSIKSVDSISFNEDSYVDDSDTCYLEDITSHVNLIINKDQLAHIVSGTALAVIGELINDLSFEIKSILYPYDKPKPTKLIESETHCYIALVNDIQYSSEKKDLILHNILSNELPFPLIAHAILIGKHVSDPSFIPQYDWFLSSVCNNLNIITIPSRDDPTNAVYPYQPIHPSIFAHASSKSTYHSTTNPSIISFNDVRTLILSGDIIQHYLKLTTFKTVNEVILQLFQCGHLCPCAPSTFPCFPASTDPFILEEPFPDVIVIGGFPEQCDSFDFMGKTITIVTVPSFAKQKTLVLFDFENKLIKPIKID
ncbi:DNA polymerase delta small subunit, putative [Entamoeba dispar SAW760]|uniref:DNA polymerase delta small subunit, putative n=1 Tax=Entamoeba dispar (strain ATCC PRA-260 / SAW760) TaxID=370354 RepID=B0ERB1_ENTDS|nr:DNA polymerase delta small subunit, putative [Entamoeba dispar SAW760]EDR22929.1 DNA polymerase delta small subunit, putative [Entamoeba dispar SAW760]|eukprot:EDR22929.1 DNA polymerase delta small subunit, putative [Entamoeba dispar SAW760]